MKALDENLKNDQTPAKLTLMYVSMLTQYTNIVNMLEIELNMYQHCPFVYISMQRFAFSSKNRCGSVHPHRAANMTAQFVLPPFGSLFELFFNYQK